MLVVLEVGTRLSTARGSLLLLFIVDGCGVGQQGLGVGLLFHLFLAFTRVLDVFLDKLLRVIKYLFFGHSLGHFD